MKSIQQINNNGGKMKNIVLTRIDDRLLHGQVVVSWIPFLKTDEIIIADDEYAADEFMAHLISESAPENIDVHVLSVNDTAKYLNGEDNNKRIMLLSRNIENIEKLIELNAPVKKVNLGGLGFADGRKKYLNAIHMSEEELGILKHIAASGTIVEIQMLPSDKAVIVE